MSAPRWVRRLAVVSVGTAAALPLAVLPTAAPAALAAQAGISTLGRAASTRAGGRRVQCIARSHKNDKMATAMARAIDASIRGRASTVGLYVTDGRIGITCKWHGAWHFYAASVIKVTILSALLLKLQHEHRHLSAAQRHLAWLMITRSDNAAANVLWYEVGYHDMQVFLNRAGMHQTRLSPYWGLTQITPHDEMIQLSLLSTRNKLLTRASRVYVRHLMANVVSWQRWGVAAGAPRRVVAHIKNGWLPYPPPRFPWEINSLGIFTYHQWVYRIAMLTFRNPTMAYGVSTIQRAAEVIQRRLNPGRMARMAPGSPNLTWGIPDETIPGAGYRRPGR